MNAHLPLSEDQVLAELAWSQRVAEHRAGITPLTVHEAVDLLDAISAATTRRLGAELDR